MYSICRPFEDTIHEIKTNPYFITSLIIISTSIIIVVSITIIIPNITIIIAIIPDSPNPRFPGPPPQTNQITK